METTKKKEKGAKVIISGTLPPEEIEKHWQKTFQTIKKDFSLPGFRKGYVPDDRILKEVGEEALWRESAESALRARAPSLIEKHAVIPIFPPIFSLSAGKKNEPVPFELTLTVPPTCKEMDYLPLAKDTLKKIEIPEREEEVRKALHLFESQIRSLRKGGEEKKEARAESGEKKEDAPLTDEDAKFVGFENLEALHFFMRGEAEKVVRDRENQKKRSAVAEALIASSECDIPDALISEESSALLEVFKRDIGAQGLQWNEYLARVKKTEKEVLTDMRPHAEKRIALEVVFAHLIKTLSLSLSEEEEGEAKKKANLLVREGGGDPARSQRYMREHLLKEKVWEMLGIKEESAV